MLQDIFRGSHLKPTYYPSIGYQDCAERLSTKAIPEWHFGFVPEKPFVSSKLTYSRRIKRLVRSMKGAATKKSRTASTAGQPTSSPLHVAQDTPSVSQGSADSVEVARRASGEEDRGPPDSSTDPTLLDQSSQSALVRRKAQIVNNVMAALMEYINTVLPPLQECDNDNRSRGTSQRKGNTTTSGGGCYDGGGDGKEGNGSRKSNKRQQRDESPDGEDGGSGEKGGGKGPKRARRDSGDGEPMFACPFYKHDPTKCTKRACSSPGFPTIHRLKEHIYRTHKIPKHICLRCREDLRSEQELGAHLRADKRCEKVDHRPWYGITEAQEALIRARPARPGKEKGSEEERWNELYKIIFPDAPDMPTPYYDEARSLAGLQQYLRQELPPLLRQELEEEVEKKLSVVEADMKRDAINAIRRLACSLIQSYTDKRQNKKASSPMPRLGSRSRSESRSRSQTEVPELPYSDTTEWVSIASDGPSYDEPGLLFQDVGLSELDYGLEGLLEQAPFYGDHSGATIDGHW